MAIGIRRRQFISALGGVTVAWPLGSSAQAPSKRPLIGFLAPGSKGSRFYAGFPEGMREAGYEVGRDYVVEERFAEGDFARLPLLAEELVGLKPDVIVTGTSAGALAAKRATSSIPIVGITLTDPVAMGLAVSEAHPGANVTGTLIRLTGLTGKQLEVGLDLVPRATMVGVLENLGNPAVVIQQEEAKSAAAKLGVNLTIVDARAEADIGPAFKKFVDERVNIVLILNDVMLFKVRRLISALALVARLPTVFYLRENVEDGGLVSYGVDLRANFRRAGFYVDKILKGEKPADLPIEFLPKLELVINLATAKALGLTIPNKLLATADDLIE